jgi:hypothetical protein
MKCIYPYEDCKRPVPANNLYCDFHRPSNIPTPGIHTSGVIAMESVRITSGGISQIDLNSKLSRFNIVTGGQLAHLKVVIREDPNFGLARIRFVLDRNELEAISPSSLVGDIADIIFNKSRPF